MKTVLLTCINFLYTLGCFHDLPDKNCLQDLMCTLLTFYIVLYYLYCVIGINFNSDVLGGCVVCAAEIKVQ